MKILQVISSFPPAYSYGGPARMAYETSKHLVKKGHDVTVYTTDVYDSESRLRYKENPMVMDGIKVYHFKNISNSMAKKNLSIAPTMAYSLSRNIKDFDIIHINEYRTLQAKFVQHYAKKYKVPYILQPRGTAPTTSKSKQKEIFDHLFGYDIVSDASKIIATSRIESSQYDKVFPKFNTEKVVHIPNPIDLDSYSNLPEKGRFRNKYHIENNEQIILFLSRIHERKGADLLIEAFSELRKELDDIKLVIAGPDEGYQEKLKSLVKKLNLRNYVIFPGPLYENNKLEAYVDADVFVLPSKDYYESFGNVVLEACACGTPVIVTENCGISEWFKDGFGYIVKPSKTELFNSLYQVFNLENAKKNQQIKAKNFALEFSWNSIIEKYEFAYGLLDDY